MARKNELNRFIQVLQPGVSKVEKASLGRTASIAIAAESREGWTDTWLGVVSLESLSRPERGTPVRRQ
ncbi:MAG: hypothetical protein A2Z37_08295 [Chloroflexi bacterium RBG_19FT_COMBO_62_14]|nr:MAG: hypothetical protein A2Z37_08295 [Chloroflexi bacterium RBG_19FT_COMBO_62_14]